MKKLLAIFGALSMLTCAVSCTKHTPADTSSETVINTLNLSFKEAKITMADDFKSIISLDKTGEQILIFGTDDSGKYMGYVTDNSFDEHTVFTFEPAENERVKSACMGKFGRSAVLTLLDDSLILHTFAKDGTPANDYDLGEHDFNTEMGAIIMANGEDYVINLNNESILSVTADGAVSEVNCKGGIIYAVSKDNADIPTVIYGHGDELSIANINGDALENERKCTNISSSPYAICGGNETYSLIADFNDGAYGLQNDTWVKLTDYMDNTFGSIDIRGMVCIGENEYAVLTSDNVLTLLSQRDISEIKAKNVITVAAWTDGYIADDVKAFNSRNDDYRLEIKLYGSQQTLKDDRITALTADILSGSPPDMLVNERGELKAEAFGARDSLFVDIYDLIDNDPEISRGDFVEGYLDALDFHGKLLSFAPGFTIDTLLIKDKFCGGITNLDYTQMMDIIANRPERMGIIPWDDSFKCGEYMLNLLDYGSFIDFENAECHFDSPEFINAMKLTKKNGLGKTMAEFEAFANDDEYEYDDYPQERYYRDDKYLIKPSRLYISSMSAIHNIVSGEFNEPVSFVGYPSFDGIGTKMQPDEHHTFSILRSCKYPEGAWQFIRDTYLTDDYYYGWNGQRCFPALEKTLTEKIDLETTAQTYTDDETGETVSNYTYYMGDEEPMEYLPFTADEAKKYGGIVREAAKHKAEYDSIIFNMILEEVTPYFEGERSAENAAEIIQSRATIYISENYG